MSAAPGEHAVSAEDVARALEAFGPEGKNWRGAVILVADGPVRIVWANDAAVRLFGTADPEVLFGRVLSPGIRGGLGESMLRLAPGSKPRLERLRVVQGFFSRVLTVSTVRSSLPDGRALFAIAVPTDDAAAVPASATASALLHSDVPAREDRSFATAVQSRSDRTIEAAWPIDGGEIDDLAAPLEDVVAEMPEQPPVVDQVVPPPAIEHSGRFVWQTDAERRIVSVVGTIPELLEMSDDALVGRSLSDALASLGADPDGVLAAALAGQATWSGLTVMWPLHHKAARVPVTLGAAPAFDAANRFEGFRGFGVVDPEQIKAALDTASAPQQKADQGSAAAEPQDADVETSPVAAPGNEPAVAVTPTSGDAEHRPIDEAVVLRSVGPNRPPGPFSSKVVALRPYQSGATPGIFARAPHTNGPVGRTPDVEHDGSPRLVLPAVDDDVDLTGERGGPTDLSSFERSAFQEIARTLGAKVPDQDDPPGPSEAAAAPSEAEASDAEVAAMRAALRESRDAKVAAVLDVLAVATLVIEHGVPVYANRAFLDLTSYASADALADAGGLNHLLGGLDPLHVFTRAEDLAFPITNQAGAVLPAEGRMDPILWDGNTADLLTLRRSTDRVLQVQTLETEIRRRDVEAVDNRGIADLVSEAVTLIDESGHIVFINRAAERLFGCEQAGVAGDPFTRLLDPGSHAAAQRLVFATHLGEADAQQTIEVTGRAAQGAKPVLQMSARPVGAARVGVTWRDLTQQRALGRDLSEAREEVDKAKAAKADFLAKVSHEIRTPLNAILGFAEVILDERFGPIGNHRYRDYIQDIHDAGARLMALVNDLLDLSRMEAGHIEVSVGAVDANRVVGECVAQMQSSAHRERVIIRLSLMQHLPAALVDEQALRQVVLNILSNAVKFNEPGGQVIVSTTVNEAGGVAVRIRDTGIGMTDAEIEQAIEPFRQIHTGKPKGGNGLGLPLARALVEANRAAMTITSQKNEGTLVEIVLRPCPAEPVRMPAE